MKKIVLTAFASAAVLALSACGHSDDPNAQASADTADMPAEEAVNSAEANAMPVAEASDDADGKTSQSVKDAAAQTAKDFEDAGDGADAKPTPKAN